ncbi:MAG: helix-hairpin-helix domain-containing protein [Candidatus Competibacter sp.]|nr:helix-hairpin-helix domain-containing protein [Candidatus Competibacter sp.]
MRVMRIALGFALALCAAVGFAQTVDINTATAGELDQGIKGIGASKAAAIVKYREANGPFQSVEDLAKVPGIKMKTVDNIRPFVTVGSGTAAARTAPAAPIKSNATPQIKGPSNPAIPAEPGKMRGPANPAVSTQPTPIQMPRNPTVPSEPPQSRGPANPAPAISPPRQ